MIQLKIRTEYTFGRTYAPIDRIVECLVSQGCNAAGIVDVDGTWGHVPFHNACTKAGIKPILGVDLSVVVDGKITRMWFLAKNKDGLKELYNLSTKAHEQSVKQHRAGLIPVLHENDVLNISCNVLKFAGNNTDGDFLHRCSAIIDINRSSRIVNLKKCEISKEHSLQIVETSDNDYVFESDAKVFEVATKSNLKMTPQHILNDLEHQDSARLIADVCLKYTLPVAKMPYCDGDLEALCRDAIPSRVKCFNKEYEDRLNYEIGLIKSKEFDSYFLIVADMVKYAKQHMLVGPSRGSASGSLVCYLTGITEIDPLPAGLYFERFMDVTRTDLPDIDLDFPDNKRHIVFEYMSNAYGLDHVAHIGTISQFRPRSALMQACKSLCIPYAAASSLKHEIITRQNADERANKCLGDTFAQTQSGKFFIEMYPEAKCAAYLEGHASHAGVHAAGLLVCSQKISDYCTVTADGIAQIDKRAAESLGLLKIDVLGLRTLTILEDAAREISDNQLDDIDWYNLPFNNQKTYDLFNSGKLCGIFQFDGNAMRGISRQISIDGIEDIDAVTAVARPGPLQSGIAQEYVNRKNQGHHDEIHPLVDAHMTSTCGLPIYQEQTLSIVKEIGMFDWEDATAIRKAISKSLGAEFFEKYYNKFKEGAMSQGISERDTDDIWGLISSMGSWQMNKAHTYSYAVISYWTAYLKANYPLEFYRANLSHAKDEDSAIRLLREAVESGIKYVAFDIDKSEINWSIKDNVLYGGFTALKGVADKKAIKLIASRHTGSVSKKQVDFLSSAYNPFDDLYPIKTMFREIYESPCDNGICGDVSLIQDLENVPRGTERVFIGELTYKNLRNRNESVNVKKRDGVLESNDLEYLDIRIKDDTGDIGGRIGRYDYKVLGRPLLVNVPIGSYILVRAIFFNGIRYAFVKKWKVLNGN